MARRLAALAFAALILAMTASSLATAGGRVDAPVATIWVEDKFEPGSCGFEYCAWHVSGTETPGNTSVDARQRIRYAGFATNFGALPGEVGWLWPLPDQSLGLRGSDLYVRHPLFVIGSSIVESAPASPLDEAAHLSWTNESIKLDYWGPSTKNGTVEPDNRTWRLDHDQGHDKYVGYDHSGPFNTPPINSTDNYTVEPIALTCYRLPPPHDACIEAANEARDEYKAAMPNVHFTFQFEDVEVATDPAILHGPREETPPLPPDEPSPAPEERPEEHDSPEEPPGPQTRSNNERSFSPHQPEVSSPLPPTPAQFATNPPPPADEAPDLPETAAIAIAIGVGLAAIINVLYTRLAGKRDALANARRQKLADLIQSRPGIRLQDVVAEVGIRRTAVLHHVRILEAWGIVKVDARHRAIHLYPGAHPVPSAPSSVVLNPVCRRLIDHVKARGGQATRAEVHAALPDVPDRTRNYNLSRLLSAGLLAEDGGLLRTRAA